MKKFKLAPSAKVQTAEQIKQKFERLATGVGENGLTPNFSYIIVSGTYDTKTGLNPQTGKPVEYPIVKSVRIGQKSNKIGGISDLSINSLKRTVNIEDNVIDVIDFTSILPNSAELNALQLLESMDESKCFAIVPNGTVLANTNFDSTIRPRQLYKVVEFSDAAKITEVLAATKAAGLTE